MTRMGGRDSGRERTVQHESAKKCERFFFVTGIIIGLFIYLFFFSINICSSHIPSEVTIPLVLSSTFFVCSLVEMCSSDYLCFYLVIRM